MKTNDIQTNVGDGNTEHVLTTNLAWVFFKNFCLSEKMKDKCNAIVPKQIMKIIIWSQGSYKTLAQIWKDWHGMILVSPSVIQTHRLLSDFKACPRQHPYMKLQVALYTISIYLCHFVISNNLFVLDPFLVRPFLTH